MPNPGTNSGITDNHRCGVVSASIAKAFQKLVAAGLQSGRHLGIPDQREPAGESTDFELTTWLVIKAQ
jgi:hypothetical protein